MRHWTTDPPGGFQVFPRMRVPGDLLQHTYQIHVINAIRRNREIDKEDLYGRALTDITHGDNSAVFADLSGLIERAVSGKLKGKKCDAAKRMFSGLPRLRYDDDGCANINGFNHRFLNDRGVFALVTILVICDAAKLDLAAVDTFRGGEALAAAYGPRQTGRKKRFGPEVQAKLKQLAVVDQPATMEAADRYVEYRFLDRGSLRHYKRRQELEGDPRSDRYLRLWFRKFNKALGYPPPPRGRPPN